MIFKRQARHLWLIDAAPLALNRLNDDDSTKMPRRWRSEEIIWRFSFFVLAVKSMAFIGRLTQQ